MDSLRSDIRNTARDPKFRTERICSYLLRILDLIEQSPVSEEEVPPVSEEEVPPVVEEVAPVVEEVTPVVEEVPPVVSEKSKKSRR